MLVGVLIFDYMYPSPVGQFKLGLTGVELERKWEGGVVKKLDFGQIRVKLFNWRGTQTVNGSLANQH